MGRVGESRSRAAALALGVAGILAGALLAAPPASAAPPANDDYADAQAIGGWEGSVVGTTVGATTEEGDRWDPTVWYAWTAPADGRARFSMGSPTPGTYATNSMIILPGGPRTRSPELGFPCDIDDYSGSYCYYLDATAGTTYSIQVGPDEDQGDEPRSFTLHWGQITAPSNDDVVDATLLTGESATFPDLADRSGALATLEPGEAPSVIKGTEARHSIWYRWTAPRDLVVDVEAKAGFPPHSQCYRSLSALEVYTTDTDPTVPVALVARDAAYTECAYARVRTPVEQGRTYLVKFNAVNGPTPLSGGLTSIPACEVSGTLGADVLVGTPGDDVLCGLGGRDVIRGGGGDDVVVGGAGDDELRGGAGDDRLRGGTGEDNCLGGRGTDTSDECQSSTSIP